jgi:hypothetical protein
MTAFKPGQHIPGNPGESRCHTMRAAQLLCIEGRVWGMKGRSKREP